MADDGSIPDPLYPYGAPPPGPPASSAGGRPSWEVISIVTAIVLVTVVVVGVLVVGAFLFVRSLESMGSALLPAGATVTRVW